MEEFMAGERRVSNKGRCHSERKRRICLRAAMVNKADSSDLRMTLELVQKEDDRTQTERCRVGMLLLCRFQRIKINTVIAQDFLFHGSGEIVALTKARQVVQEFL